MKKLAAILFLAAMFIAMPSKTSAQNIQLHHDIDRNATTTTVEMFRPDAAGSTFFFIDLDYSPKVSGAYWEISREFCFWKESKLEGVKEYILKQL